jgi:hypothetical protein
MKKVKDVDGSEMRGLYKTASGAIIVDDPHKFKIYQKRKEIALRENQEIEYLKSQIKELHFMLEQLRK